MLDERNGGWGISVEECVEEIGELIVIVKGVIGLFVKVKKGYIEYDGR